MQILTKMMMGVVLLSGALRAQSSGETAPRSARNTLYATAHSAIVTVGVGLSYERSLYFAPDAWLPAGHLRVSTGLAAITLPPGNDYASTHSLSYVGLTGSGDHHLEFNLGAGLNVEHEGQLETIDNPTFVPVAGLGYRYQALQQTNSFVFRIGANLPQGAYLSLGLAL